MSSCYILKLYYIFYVRYLHLYVLYLIILNNLGVVFSEASAMTDELNIKPLTERKRDSDKESMLNVC